MVMVNNCENVGFGLVRSTSFGRKRVSLPKLGDFDFICTTPKKKSRSRSFVKSPLEALPQDILIKIVCGVDHDDLKRLFHVSRHIREATVIAKKWHFEYSTPRRTIGFKTAMDMEYSGEFSDAEAPNAPRQMKVPMARLSRKKLADISVALFTSDGDENWPLRELFMQMDTEV